MDQIIRMIAKDAPVKASAISGRDLVERARNIHMLLPVATAALGRALMGTSMMGDALKEEKGALTKSFKTPFRKREEWKFKIEDFEN